MAEATFAPPTERITYISGDALSWTRWYVGDDLTADTFTAEIRARAFNGAASTSNPVLADIDVVTAIELDADVRASLVAAAAEYGVTLDLTGVDVTRFELSVDDTTELPSTSVFDVQIVGGRTIYRGTLIAYRQVST